MEDRALPGFGHMLYPDDDPRAAALLERFTPPPDLQALLDACTSDSYGAQVIVKSAGD